MTRLDFDATDPAGSSPHVAAVFEQRLDDWGEVSELFQLVAVNEAALIPFSKMSRYVRRESSLPPRAVELVALRVAGWLDLDYVRARHTALAAASGLTAAEIAALADVDAEPDLGSADLAVLRVVDELMRPGRVAKETFGMLAAELTAPQVVDVCLATGWYQLIGCVIRTLDL